jgi:hypothetical protein
MTPPDVSGVAVPRPALSPSTAQPDRGAFLFGLILFAVGAFIVAMAGGLIPATLTVPREVVMAPGVGMVAFGL